MLGEAYDAPLELDEPEPEPMCGQFPLCGVLGAVVLGAVVLGVVVVGVVVVELPLAAQAAPPAPSAAAARTGAMYRRRVTDTSFRSLPSIRPAAPKSRPRVPWEFV